MEERKAGLGDGVAEETKNVLNEETKEIINIAIRVFSKKIKEKIPELPDMVERKIRDLADSQKGG